MKQLIYIDKKANLECYFEQINSAICAIGIKSNNLLTA